MEGFRWSYKADGSCYWATRRRETKSTVFTITNIYEDGRYGTGDKRFRWAANTGNHRRLEGYSWSAEVAQTLNTPYSIILNRALSRTTLLGTFDTPILAIFL